MIRPTDEQNNILKPAHTFLTQSAAIQQKIVFALSEDARACHLTLLTKIKIAQAAIDNVADGRKPVRWIFDGSPTVERLLPDLWRWAVDIARTELAKAP